MRAVTLTPGTGRVEVTEAPDPLVRRGRVLVAGACSVLSAGTERGLVDLARASLLGKARRRPDQVRQVLRALQRDGLITTWERVKDRLDEPFPLGYSASGVVLAVGSGVEGLAPGDRVAAAAPHATVAAVPRPLVAALPDGVSLEAGAFTVLGAIALHGFRLAGAGLGETVFVVGLGLLGQLAVGVARAAGSRVLATDPDPGRCALARRFGADVAQPGLTAQDVGAATAGLGADAVLVTASSADSAPTRLAVEAVRSKGRVVVVGAVGLELDRRPLHAKECELVVSRSYGPGRHDADYEERGRDYPADAVRWTEQRNLAGVLDLMARGLLDPTPLVTHRFPISEAARAYELIDRADPQALGVLLDHAPPGGAAPRMARSLVELRPPPRRGERAAAAGERAGAAGVAVLGAGGFARSTLLPTLARTEGLRPVVLCSAGGLSARTAGDRHGFEAVTTSEEEALTRRGVDAVIVLTRHADHARQTADALRAGRHVLCEKPLARTRQDLAVVEAAREHPAAAGRVLAVGFNRRFAPAVQALADHLATVAEPLAVTVRVNAGTLPADHWTQDEEEGGGRLVGEACHAIDLATHLARSVPVRVHAEVVGGAAAPPVASDRAVITMRHANGAISSIVYVAGGDPSLAKERIEVFGGGRAAVLDDNARLDLHADGRRRTTRWRRDVGHAAQLAAFARAVRGLAPWPVAWTELRAVTLAALAAVESAREGAAIEI